MNHHLMPFDMPAMLDSANAIIEYLSQVLANGETDGLIWPLAHVAKARGIAHITRD
jgi:DNA-binding phage protein